MRKVIVISAHPDDETLGAGGTLLKHVANGDEVSWLIVTNISENQGFSKERVEARQNEIKIVDAKNFALMFVNYEGSMEAGIKHYINYYLSQNKPSAAISSS